jgi:hypothetical protein
MAKNNRCLRVVDELEKRTQALQENQQVDAFGIYPLLHQENELTIAGIHAAGIFPKQVYIVIKIYSKIFFNLCV